MCLCCYYGLRLPALRRASGGGGGGTPGKSLEQDGLYHARLVKAFKWKDSQGTLQQQGGLLFPRQLAPKDVEDKGASLI